MGNDDGQVAVETIPDCSLWCEYYMRYICVVNLSLLFLSSVHVESCVFISVLLYLGVPPRREHTPSPQSLPPRIQSSF